MSKLAILFSLLLIIFSSVSSITNNDITSPTICNDEEILHRVKSFLEDQRVKKLLRKSSAFLKINFQAIWENLVRLDKICLSEEAELLQFFCIEPVKHFMAAYRFHEETNMVPYLVDKFLMVFAILQLSSNAKDDYPDLCEGLRESGSLMSGTAIKFRQMDAVIQKFMTMPDKSVPPKHNLRLHNPFVETLKRNQKKTEETPKTLVEETAIQKAFRESMENRVKSIENKLKAQEKMTRRKRMVGKIGRKEVKPEAHEDEL